MSLSPSTDLFDVLYNGCLNVYVELFDLVYEVLLPLTLDGTAQNQEQGLLHLTQADICKHSHKTIKMYRNLTHLLSFGFHFVINNITVKLGYS